MNNSLETPGAALDILGNPEIQSVALFNEQRARLLKGIALQLMATKTWSAMDTEERNACVRYVVGESSTEEELRAELAELGMEYFEIAWQDVDPEDKISLEAQLLVRAMDGPISKTGALVMVMTLDDGMF